MLPLFFIPMLLNPTYSFIVCSISIVIISVQYLQSGSTTVSLTAVNSIYLLMISCTSYFSSYNPLFILSVGHSNSLPSTDPGRGAPPCGQQQELPFPTPYFFPLEKAVHLGFLVLLTVQLIQS